jgi:hypothetical protein
MRADVKYTPVGSAVDYSRKTICILPNYLDDEPLAGCLQRFLSEDLPEVTFFPEESFRDAMFPWFEYSTAPGDAATLSRILEKPLVRSQIDKLGVEILIYVHGKTIQDQMDGPGFCGGGYGGGGCLGYVSADRETYIATSVFDLKQAAAVSSTDIHYKGTVHVPMLIIPIPIPVFTESSACKETARRISDSLKAKTD